MSITAVRTTSVSTLWLRTITLEDSHRKDASTVSGVSIMPRDCLYGSRNGTTVPTGRARAVSARMQDGTPGVRAMTTPRTENGCATYFGVQINRRTPSGWNDWQYITPWKADGKSSPTDRLRPVERYGEPMRVAWPTTATRGASTISCPGSTMRLIPWKLRSTSAPRRWSSNGRIPTRT